MQDMYWSLSSVGAPFMSVSMDWLCCSQWHSHQFSKVDCVHHPVFPLHEELWSQIFSSLFPHYQVSAKCLNLTEPFLTTQFTGHSNFDIFIQCCLSLLAFITICSYLVCSFELLLSVFTQSTNSRKSRILLSLSRLILANNLITILLVSYI